MIYTAEKLQKGTAALAMTLSLRPGSGLSACVIAATLAGVSGGAGSFVASGELAPNNFELNQDRPRQFGQDQPYPSEAITQQITGKGRQH